MSETRKAREAVTAVLLCGDEMFLVHRHVALKAFPGYWAFPGGKIDKEDADAAVRTASWCRDFNPTHIEGLVRELREEIDFDLDAAAQSGVLESAHLLGSALAPAFVPVRFDTFFFVLRLREKPKITLDVGEVDQSRWATPAQLMSDYHAGQLLLAPPTRVTIELLARDSVNLPDTHPIEEFHKDRHPVLQPIHQMRVISVRSNTLPPAIHTNCFVIGDDGAPRLMVDPSPWTDDEMEALQARVQEFNISEIFLTHHHPDHRERANQLALRMDVGMAMSADTHARIGKAEPAYFDGVRTRLLEDREQVTLWLGKPVRALAVPGHDEGQLALMPDCRSWCIVGDLIQGIGTVVIHKPEGNMAKYFRSLKRVIELDPKVIAPSHGIAMGSTHRLLETLKHRKMREASVLEMHRAGDSVDQMLAAIYAKIDPRLLPLARQNIESHLDKLREEGALA